METTGGRRCRACTSTLAHCHGTLVLHADGTVECEESASCGGDGLGHEWWVACSELEPPCGCTGDERPLVEPLGQAA